MSGSGSLSDASRSDGNDLPRASAYDDIGRCVTTAVGAAVLTRPLTAEHALLVARAAVRRALDLHDHKSAIEWQRGRDKDDTHAVWTSAATDYEAGCTVLRHSARVAAPMDKVEAFVRRGKVRFSALGRRRRGDDAHVRTLESFASNLRVRQAVVSCGVMRRAREFVFLEYDDKLPTGAGRGSIVVTRSVHCAAAAAGDAAPAASAVRGEIIHNAFIVQPGRARGVTRLTHIVCIAVNGRTPQQLSQRVVRKNAKKTVERIVAKFADFWK